MHTLDINGEATPFVTTNRVQAPTDPTEIAAWYRAAADEVAMLDDDNNTPAARAARRELTAARDAWNAAGQPRRSRRFGRRTPAPAPVAETTETTPPVAMLPAPTPLTLAETETEAAVTQAWNRQSTIHAAYVAGDKALADRLNRMWAAADRLADLRATGYTVRQIADLLGVSTTTVYRWASGQRCPRPEHAETLAELVDISYTV